MTRHNKPEKGYHLPPTIYLKDASVRVKQGRLEAYVNASTQSVSVVLQMGVVRGVKRK